MGDPSDRSCTQCAATTETALRHCAARISVQDEHASASDPQRVKVDLIASSQQGLP